MTQDGNGRSYRFIQSLNDDVYVVPPADVVPDGMLPPEEFEVRHAMLTLKVLRINIAADKTPNVEGAARALRSTESELTRVANRSWQHKCAVRRLASVLPADSSEKAELLAYLL